VLEPHARRRHDADSRARSIDGGAARGSDRCTGRCRGDTTATNRTRNATVIASRPGCAGTADANHDDHDVAEWNDNHDDAGASTAAFGRRSAAAGARPDESGAATGSRHTDATRRADAADAESDARTDAAEHDADARSRKRDADAGAADSR
jgi:hypothetical protein